MFHYRSKSLRRSDCSGALTYRAAQGTGKPCCCKPCCARPCTKPCRPRYPSQHPEYRSIDGTGNNLRHPAWGASNTELLRLSEPDYEDGVSTPAVRGSTNPNPRQISNVICKCTAPDNDCPLDDTLTPFFWLWGQFVDHELDLTDTGNESFNVITPNTAEEDYPDYTIPFNRSLGIYGTGTSTENPRQQANTVTSFLDASNVYGSTAQRSNWLRRLDGSGKLLSSTLDNGEVGLPYNTVGAPNALPPGPSDPTEFFLAGDVRANENTFLTAMHTLFLREHNRLCDEILSAEPSLAGKDEVIFQKARKIVGGIQQNITMKEFMPRLLGRNWSEPYSGYDPKVDPSVSTEFSTVAYRLGHTMVNQVLIDEGTEAEIPLRDSFFNPQYVTANGVDGLLAGGVQQHMERIDSKITEELRSFLFETPNPATKMMLDLATLNIQRARDHGICGYNELRRQMGLPPYTDFSEISQDPVVVEKLREVYDDDIEAIDPWVGCLCEEHLPNAKVGPLLAAVLADQFSRMRDGDFYWFENDPYLSESWKERIRRTRLSDVLARNTRYKNWPREVMVAA